jgi:hypothetical protein
MWFRSSTKYLTKQRTQHSLSVILDPPAPAAQPTSAASSCLKRSLISDQIRPIIVEQSLCAEDLSKISPALLARSSPLD